MTKGGKVEETKVKRVIRWDRSDGVRGGGRLVVVVVEKVPRGAQR